MTGHEFARALARHLGLPSLTEPESEQILELASVAAHSSERLAAPLCAFLAGRSGRSIGEVTAAARRVTGGER